ncbi:MAG: hypothetical protein HY913_20350 [Desulfomonile tiedjei]|nr:hypothetical protein [Desulfomonile tiedjei]
MRETSSKLDALSEMLALSSHGNTKNVLMNAVEAQGPFDLDGLRLAISQLPQDFPELMTCLKEVRNWGRHYLLREYRPDFTIPVVFSELQVEGTSSVLSSLMDHLAPRLDAHWDLFNKPALKYHIVRVAEDHHVIAQVAHHVVADGGTAAEVGKKMFERYDKIMKGSKPEWACQPHAMSTLQKRMVQVKKPSFKQVLSNVRDTLGHFMDKTTLPAGSGSLQDARQHHVKRKLSIAQTEAITKPSSGRGSLVDHLVVGTNIAIDRWNEHFNKTPGILTTSMTVNMKGRFRTFNTVNNSGLIFFRSQPEERKSPAAFAKSVALSRIKQFRRQMDFKFYQDISRMNAVLRPFPFAARSKIVNFIMNQHQFSMAITLLGVIWPETKNGKPTANTCFTHSGDFTLSEVHGVGYKLLSNTHLLLIVYVFRNQLNFLLHASACLFTRQEAEAFMDLVMENLLVDPVN